MADHPVPADKIAAHDFTLAASTVDTVTFVDNPSNVEVLTDGTAAIYVTTDGTVPTVSGNNTYIIPAFPCIRVVRHWNPASAVQLISSGTPKVSVTRV